MAPNCKIPEEIDCFTVPHSRMKELVNIYTQRVHCVDFRDCQQVWKLLDELNHIFYEFKSHESIENMFIMDQLKNRLKQRHIYNSAVCNCHNDNRITEMMKLVRSGKYVLKNGVGKRISFGHKLQKKFSNFVKQFLPHMEEEENIFQPLLIEHFEYDELKIIKEVVLEQHELIKDPQYCEKAGREERETDEAIKDCRDIDESVWCLADLFNIPEEKVIPTQKEQPQIQTVSSIKLDTTANWLSLPAEVSLKIFEYLEPPDRGRCAQVCSLWNKYAYTNCIWREIYPIQWARGIWNWKDMHLNWEMEDRASICNAPKWDEDADVDETENAPTKESKDEINMFNSIICYLLPRVGNGVKSLNMDGGSNIPSRMIREAFVQCPNLVKLSAAYCNIDYYSFKGLWQKNCMAELKHLDLQGCMAVDDRAMYSLLDCMNMKKFQNSRIPCINNNTTLLVCPFGNMSATNCVCRSQQSIMAPKFCPLSKKKGRIAYNNDGSCNIPNGKINYDENSKSVDYATLTHLNLSGCYRIKGISLIGMADDGFLSNLSSLNLSGCFQIPVNYLWLVTQFCPKLNPIHFSYCDEIHGGPFDSEANGCDSVNHPLKVCCKSIRLD